MRCERLRHERTGREVGRAGGALWRGVLGTLLAAGCVLGFGAEGARADACSKCGPPTKAQFDADPNYALQRRGGEWDYVEMDGGECRVQIEGTPVATCTSAWLVLRGQGEVWSCPHSTSSDTVTVSTTQADTRGWCMSGSLSIGGSVLGARRRQRLVRSDPDRRGRRLLRRLRAGLPGLQSHLPDAPASPALAGQRRAPLKAGLWPPPTTASATSAERFR